MLWIEKVYQATRRYLSGEPRASLINFEADPDKLSLSKALLLTCYCIFQDKMDFILDKDRRPIFLALLSTFQTHSTEGKVHVIL